jgi:hypothetical protein
MTLQQALEAARPHPETVAARPVAWKGEAVGLFWSEPDRGWIGWRFTDHTRSRIVDEYRIPALGFVEWETVTPETLKAEGEAKRC